MTSFKQMQNEGTIKRKDQPRIRYEDIHIMPGFNPPGRHDTDDEDDISLRQHIMAGGLFPALEVFPRDEGGVWLVDGHRRYVQIGKAVAAGYQGLFDKKTGELWVDIVQFEGDAVKRKARVVTSQKKKALTALQAALHYKSMRDEDGLGPEDIAREIGMTRQHVDQLLHLADASPEVQQMVADGTVAPTEAIKVARKHGADAAKVLGEAAAGTGKVTAKALKPWVPPASHIAPLVQTVDKLAEGISNDVRSDLLKMESNGTLATAKVTVQLPADVVFKLLDQQFGISEERKRAEEKAAAKAKNATQGDLAGAAA